MQERARILRALSVEKNLAFRRAFAGQVLPALTLAREEELGESVVLTDNYIHARVAAHDRRPQPPGPGSDRRGAPQRHLGFARLTSCSFEVNGCGARLAQRLDARPTQSRERRRVPQSSRFQDHDRDCRIVAVRDAEVGPADLEGTGHALRLALQAQPRRPRVVPFHLDVAAT